MSIMELVEDNAGEPTDAPKKNKKKFVHPKKSTDERKKDKEARRLRKARVILRNISYKTTPAKLQAEFAKYGTIKECNVLKRADGKLVGCAFVQFEKVNHAAKAIHHGNGKEFLGRPVIIDWAVNQKKFTEHLKKNQNNTSVKTEDDDENDDENDDEDQDDDDTSIKSEPESDASHDGESDGDSDENDDEEDSKADLEDSKVGIKPDPDADDVKPKISNKNDIGEGCTVFIKNVPFAATNDDLYKVCRQFGKIKYALVTTDKVSGHSKGNGFVKYKSKDSADMCLSAGTSFKLLDQILDPHAALTRHDIKEKQDSKTKKEPTDSRNLYLAKEGVIAAGSPAAEGVSPSDMAKRLFMEQSKAQMLKNLNRFVSKDRLSVHNIPPTYDNVRLRKVIEKTSKVKPKECRIMRENKPSMGQPMGKSKGYAFLSFKTHNEALLCLRRVNNNPEAFGKNNRPIVSFSIEDKAALNLKMKRLKKSQDNNPLHKNKKDRRKEKREKKKEKKPDIKPKLNGVSTKTVESEKAEPVLPQFSGSVSKKGSQFKARAKWQLREESTIHNKQVGDHKKAVKRKREHDTIRKEKQEIERPKPGTGKVKREADSSLVNKYLRMLHSKDEKSAPKSKRTKWFVE